MSNLLILASEAGGHAANNWLFGDVKEVIVTGLASVILFALLGWKAGPAIKKGWNDRITNIETEITEAEAARATGEAALADVQGRIANAEAERSRILSEARATAEQVKAGLIARGEEEAAAIRSRAGTDIEAAKAQAAADLQAEVTRLAVGAAESVVAGALDASTQSELIDSYINQVGASA